MIPTAIILFREVFEVALILSVILVATKGLEGRGKWIGLGVGAGLVGSVIIGLFVQFIGGTTKDAGFVLFEAAVLLTAAAVIGWTVIWMKRHARAMTAHLKQVGASVVDGALPSHALSVVIGLAVLREGAEVVLLTYGLATKGTTIFNILAGGTLGTIAGVAAGALFYFGVLKLSTKHLFAFTSVLLVLLAAGMASSGVKYMVRADLVPAWGDPLWDSSFLVSQQSIGGQVLHALIGYSEKPYGIQAAVFFLTVVALTIGLKLAGQPKKAAEKPAKS